MKLFSTLSFLAALSVSVLFGETEKNVSAVVDVTHGYDFYIGFGTLGKQYIQPQNVVNNWRSFNKLDLTNANLMILPACDNRVPYTDADKNTMKKFVEEGGVLFIKSNEGQTAQNEMVKFFGADFAGKVKDPLKATKHLNAEKIENKGGSCLKLENPEDWTILVEDAEGKPVMAQKKQGKGTVLVLTASMIGDSKGLDPQAAGRGMNNDWLKELFSELVKSKKVDMDKKVPAGDLVDTDNSRQVGSIKYHWSDYLKDSAEAMIAIEKRCRPNIEKRMGVPLSDGMSSEVGLLSTGGGGYSNGRHIGLAVFWGGFPEKGEDSMVEFITHENVHSWVHPYTEPYWNEPIATYVGNLVMMDEGFAEEAQKRIDACIQRAKKHDPDMTLYHLDGTSTKEGAPALEGGQRNDICWGKSFWIFEELRKLDPDFNAKYFQTKRKYAKDLEGGYTLDNAVAVISHAAKKDMFPWFQKHGIKVDKSKVTVNFDEPK